jgi:alkylation response protein AidB-like acyl-CoA dehydrogenase
VNFDYTDDQKALKDEARRFLADVAPLAVARGVLENPAEGYDPALWARIAEQGWCGAAIPEQYGGIGMGYVELCALAEELGRAVAPVPFASSVYLFAEALLMAGSEERKAALLPQVSSGALIATAAVSEGPGVLADDRIATRCENGKLTGVKLPVTDGMIAGKAVVLARPVEIDQEQARTVSGPR